MLADRGEACPEYEAQLKYEAFVRDWIREEADAQRMREPSARVILPYNPFQSRWEEFSEDMRGL